MKYLTYIFQDWSVNKNNWKILITLTAFRTSQIIYNGPLWLYTLGFFLLVIYRIVVEWILGIELHPQLTIGPNLRIYHGYGLVVHSKSIIGSNCVLRHCTTIGDRGTVDKKISTLPVIGNHVEIGSNVVILGNIHIGDYAIIGSGSVVLHDVPVGAVVAGNPAKIIRYRKEIVLDKLSEKD